MKFLLTLALMLTVAQGYACDPAEARRSAARIVQGYEKDADTFYKEELRRQLAEMEKQAEAHRASVSEELAKLLAEVKERRHAAVNGLLDNYSQRKADSLAVRIKLENEAHAKRSRVYGERIAEDNSFSAMTQAANETKAVWPDEINAATGGWRARQSQMNDDRKKDNNALRTTFDTEVKELRDANDARLAIFKKPGRPT